MDKLVIGVAVIAALIGTPALAADMAVKAPPPPPAPVYSWTGCYLGANVGYGWAPTKWSDPTTGLEFASHTADGVVGGGQIGCDYQFDPRWVIGIRGMFDGTDMSGDSHKVIGAGGPDIFDHTRVSWFTTLTGRIAYAIQPITLLYVQAGAAWVRDKLDECCLSAAAPVDDGFANVTRTGWTVGVGLEHMFRPKLVSIRGVQLYWLGHRYHNFRANRFCNIAFDLQHPTRRSHALSRYQLSLWCVREPVASNATRPDPTEATNGRSDVRVWPVAYLL
jgi:outer membrane immunogenic protein